MSSTISPLPSLIRASASDAGDMHMRKAGRAQWNQDDWNRMCEVQERLIRACFGKDDDRPTDCFIRFQIAERLERAGKLHLGMSADDIIEMADSVLDITPRDNIHRLEAAE